ncbi:unnamed protein product [Penicillium egyptiacum]|uniref:F-box domain-containing protein n=1 Tax=Penicillium egyptiacum TaxID=1303716 RepID=A0A9W4KBJ5_9EURO|nr:unnamed protein product [Penicillium egyptiacum]
MIQRNNLRRKSAVLCFAKTTLPMPEHAMSGVLNYILVFYLEPFYTNMPSETEHPKASMWDLPPELVDQIIDLLPIESQVYLALSCRSLYRRYQHVLAQDEFAFPRYESGLGWLPYGLLDENSNREYNFRRQLLCRLQGPRRLYCSSCSKLHLTNEFGLLSNIVPRICERLSRSPLNIRAMTRTLEGSQREWLEWRRCSVTIQPEVVAEQKLYISPDEQTFLRVRSQWEITYKEETNDCPKIERFFGCPHRCMLPEFPTSRSRKRFNKCYECNLCIKTHWNEVDRSVFQVEITRTVDTREILRSR